MDLLQDFQLQYGEKTTANTAWHGYAAQAQPAKLTAGQHSVYAHVAAGIEPKLNTE